MFDYFYCISKKTYPFLLGMSLYVLYINETFSLGTMRSQQGFQKEDNYNIIEELRLISVVILTNLSIGAKRAAEGELLIPT